MVPDVQKLFRTLVLRNNFKHMRKRIIQVFLLLLLIALIWGGWRTYPMIKIGLAYSSKIMCSCVFVSQRSPESVMAEDLNAFSFADIQVDRETETVTASFLGLSRTALYRKGLGCTLDSGRSVEELRAQAYTAPEISRYDTAYWPLGDRDTFPQPEGVNQQLLDEAFDKAFSEPFEDKKRYTRAAMVVYKDKIIAERYAPGIDAKTPLIGWSMTKSVTNTMVGMLVKEGKLDIYGPAPVPEWQIEADDPRAAITINDLFHMASGLAFEEDYSKASVVNRMLWLEPDAGAIAADQPLADPINTQWYYSSGTTNIISRIVRAQFEQEQDYLDFPRKALFDPLGMTTTIIEPDPSGTFVGSSLMYASARDWRVMAFYTSTTESGKGSAFCQQAG